MAKTKMERKKDVSWALFNFYVTSLKISEKMNLLSQAAKRGLKSASELSRLLKAMQKEKPMAKPKTVFFVISCSADGEDVNVRFLYMHGEGSHGILPTTIKEAKERIRECYSKQKCNVCDAEIHRCDIVRQTKTYKLGSYQNENKLDLRAIIPIMHEPTT